MQRAIVGMHDLAVVGLDEYKARRDLLYGELTGMGFEVVEPQGAFYMFPKAPITDDVDFCGEARKQLILLVPGIGFGRAGHVRISYSSIPFGHIQRSLPAFQALAQHYGLS